MLQAARAVMVLLSLHGLPPSQIAELLDRHPATVRRWIIRFNSEGLAGLADRPRCGRPRRPKLTARGDPAHDQVVAGIVARLLELPRRSVVLADETHLNLLPHVRASWTPRGLRPGVLTPGTNRKVTVLGAVEVSTGAWLADNHASDQHYGPIDRVHVYPYRSSQDRVEAVHVYE